MIVQNLLKKVRVPFLCNGTLISQEVIEKTSKQFSNVLSDADITSILAFIVRWLLIKKEAYHLCKTTTLYWLEYNKEDSLFINNFYQKLFEEYKQQHNTKSVTIQHVVDEWIEKKLDIIQLENMEQYKSCCNPTRCCKLDGSDNKQDKIVHNRILKRISSSNTQDMIYINGGKFLVRTDYE